MMRKFDKNDVLKFLYGELSPEDHADFIEAMCSDEDLFAAYEEMKEAHEALETISSEPSPAAVETVLEYVRREPRQRPGERFLPRGKNKLVSLHTLVTTAMVICTLITLGISLYAIQKNQEPEPIFSQTSLDWDDSHLWDRLRFARQNLNNLNGDRVLPLPVYHDTYRELNTSQPIPAEPVVLLNIK